MCHRCGSTEQYRSWWHGCIRGGRAGNYAVRIQEHVLVGAGAVFITPHVALAAGIAVIGRPFIRNASCGATWPRPLPYIRLLHSEGDFRGSRRKCTYYPSPGCVGVAVTADVAAGSALWGHRHR